MPIRFQAATAPSAGLAGMKDGEVLALAARDGRVLVTHDQTTMPTHFAEFVRLNQSPGLVVVSQSLPVREAVDDLILIWTATRPEEWINWIVYLPL